MMGADGARLARSAWGQPHTAVGASAPVAHGGRVLRHLCALMLLTAVFGMPAGGVGAATATTAEVVATIQVGPTPFGINVTPDGSRVYVSNSTGGSVSVVDTASRSVSSTITANVGTTPVGISIDAGGTYAYVANYGAGTVTRITVSSGATSSIDVSGAIGGVCANLLNIALSPDGATLYAACQDQNRVVSAPVSGGGGNVLMSVHATAPTDVALSSDGSTLVSSLSQSNQAFIVDGAGSGFVSVTTGPYAVAVSPTSGLAYLAGQTSGAISVVDTASRSTVGSTISVGGHLSDIAITPDGTTALVSVLDQDVVRMVSLSTGEVIGTIPVGDGPQSLTISHDGRYAYTANRYDNTVSMIALPETPASGEQVPIAAMQQFVRAEGQACDRAPDDFVDLPALSPSVRNDAWGGSWAQWPNGGTGGFVCTRQPYYTGSGTWAVR